MLQITECISVSYAHEYAVPYVACESPLSSHMPLGFTEFVLWTYPPPETRVALGQAQGWQQSLVMNLSCRRT